MLFALAGLNMYFCATQQVLLYNNGNKSAKLPLTCKRSERRPLSEFGSVRKILIYFFVIFSYLDREMLRMSFHKTISIRVCNDKVLIIVIIGPDFIKFYKRIYTLFVCYRFSTIYPTQNVTKAFRPEKFANHLYII
jgi:hypothetical protein